MKRTKYILLLLLPVFIVLSCKKSSFVDVNIDPSTLITVDPGNQFLSAATHASNDFEYYYDVYRAIMPWMQYITGSGGNAPSFTNVSGNFNYRYGNFYNNVGVPLVDIPHLIAGMSPSNAATRVYESDIAAIYKAYYAFYVSDINGSIPYTQAFQARYGGTLTPLYDAQAALFDTLDNQIKTAVTSLETSQSVTQTLYGAFDPFYGDADPLNSGTPSAAAETLSWIKAGNALRLKIAMRLLARNASQVQSIVTDVLADPNQMASFKDSWVFFAGPAFATQGSNYNPTGFLASETMVNYMLSTSDPRLPIYFRPNSSGHFVGCPTNPDTTSPSSYQGHFSGNDSGFSAVQHRLFTPDFDEGDGNGSGTGVGFFPYITYAEYCFIRAELGQRGVTSDVASTWYANGVTASIQFYDAMGSGTGIAGYKSVTANQISNYLTAPAVAYNPANGLQQIACQAYLDFYRQPQEAWSWWKRTGFPNTSSVVPWSALTTGGTTLVLPRRAALTVLPASDPNYVNQQAAFTQMETDPGFGTPDNAGGRVWWDMP
jgi:hypothetical protein